MNKIFRTKLQTAWKQTLYFLGLSDEAQVGKKNEYTCELIVPTGGDPFCDGIHLFKRKTPKSV